MRPAEIKRISEARKYKRGTSVGRTVRSVGFLSAPTRELHSRPKPAYNIPQRDNSANERTTNDLRKLAYPRIKSLLSCLG